MNAIERIKYIRNKTGLSQPKFAKEIGVPDSTVNSIESGKQKISVELAELLAEKYNLSFEWILTGKGEISLITEECKHKLSDCVKIPLLKINASLGGGFEVNTEETEFIDVPKHFIKCNVKDAVCVRSSGQSMKPTVNDGDILVVDKSSKHLEDSELYVVSYENKLFCKRLLVGLTYIKLKSDNPEYDIEKIEGEERDKLNVIGRVVFRMNEF